MRPDVIITDELSTQDVTALEKLVSSGVGVIASIHAEKIEQLPKNCHEAFDKIVFLKSGKIGEIDRIYQKFGSEFVAI